MTASAVAKKLPVKTLYFDHKTEKYANGLKVFSLAWDHSVSRTPHLA